jgi:hypothetical protein
MLCRKVEELFHQAVAADAASHFEILRKERARHGLDAVPFLGAPVYFNVRDRQRISHILSRLTSAIERVGDCYFSSGSLPGNQTMRYHIPLGDRVVRLCRLDCSRTPRLCVSRYDAMADPHSGAFQVLEINPGDPSGLGYHDVVLDGFLASSATRVVRSRFQVITDHLLPLHRQELISSLPISPKSPSPPTLAFAVARHSTVLDDHRVMVTAARAAGFPAYICDPRDFTWDGERMRVSGIPVDIAWRDIIDEFVLDEYWDPTEPFRTAYCQGAIGLRNQFSSAFAECKGVFAILSDPRYAPLFDADENEVIRAHIPWTRLLLENRTTYEGSETDLLRLIGENRECFVIKPNIGCCGFRVLVGCECSQAEWDARIEQAIATPGCDVVQRYYPLPTAIFPTVSGGQEELAFVSSFWQFGQPKAGMFDGSLIRASNKRVINIHQGGGISTIYWVSQS